MGNNTYGSKLVMSDLGTPDYFEEASISGAYKLTKGGVLCYSSSTTELTAPKVVTNSIKFPVTFSNNTDPNTLDDYEEGVFSPVFTCGVTNPVCTYAVQIAQYTKIGRVVTFNMVLQVNPLTSPGNGELRLSLPFQCNQSAPVVLGNNQLIRTYSTNHTIKAGIAYNTAYIVFHSADDLITQVLGMTGQTNFKQYNSTECWLSLAGSYTTLV